MSYNIMIVDDSPTIRAVIKKTLSMARIPTNELHEAGNGREALEILKNNWVDLVFADINMPEMNGIEMIDIMSKDESLNKIPVVVVSTEGSTTRIEELQSKGIRGYVRKPFTPEIIRKVVDNVLGEAKTIG